MRVLIVSNMYPSKEKPYAGIFIKNQFNALVDQLGRKTIDIKYMKRTVTGPLGSFIKYIYFFIRILPIYFKKYDIIHFHYFFLITFLIPYKLLYKNTKFICTFHGQDIIRQVDNTSFFFIFIKYLMNYIDFSIPVGKRIAYEVENKLMIKIGAIIPVGVNKKIFFKETNIEKRYDFIFVGSFIYIKGLDVIINAIEETGTSGRNISYCFVGIGEYKNNLNKIKSKYNITIFDSKPQIHLRALYNCSRFFISHSRSEGFPTAPIEAMYCGLPVLVSDIPQCREQVIDTRNGWIIPLCDFKALAQSILKLFRMNDNVYNIHVNNSLKAHRDLELSHVANELSNIYKKII